MLKNFIISDGCRPNPATLIHLFAPFTSNPIPGTKTNKSKINPKVISKRSYEIQKFSGNIKKISKPNKPRKK